MNQINCVTRNWMSNRFEVDVDEYTVIPAGKLSMGLYKYAGGIEVVIFETKSRPNNNGIGRFVFERKVVGGIVCYAPESAQIIPHYQGKSIGPMVYKFLAKCGYNIRTGTSMSEGAAKMWSKLTQTKGFSVLSQIKGKWYEIEDIEPMDIYEENVMVLFAD